MHGMGGLAFVIASATHLARPLRALLCKACAQHWRTALAHTRAHSTHTHTRPHVCICRCTAARA